MSFGVLELLVTLTFFFIGLNRSGPWTSSTANHIFYRALGQLHDPWCKQPLKHTKRSPWRSIHALNVKSPHTLSSTSPESTFIPKMCSVRIRYKEKSN